MSTQLANPATLTLAEAATLVETSEANMYRAIMGNLPEQHKKDYGATWRDVGLATAVFLAKLPVTAFNRVIGLGLLEPATEAMIDDCINLYGRIGAPFGISVSPAAQPTDLEAWLLERGFQRSGAWAKVLRGDESPAEIATDLRIEAVTAEKADDFAQALVTAYGMPPWMAPMLAYIATMPDVYNYVAYDGALPVAAGSMYVQGEVGSLFNGGTVPQYRRRGAQGAIMARRIKDGLALGCRWFTSETGEDTPEAPNPSYHNMMRNGFKLAYLRPNYELVPNSTPSGL